VAYFCSHVHLHTCGTAYWFFFVCSANYAAAAAAAALLPQVLNVGSFNTEAEAAQAWNAAAIHFRGPNTLLNAVQPQLPEDGGVTVANSLPQPPWGSQLLNSMPGDEQQQQQQGGEEEGEGGEGAVGSGDSAEEQQEGASDGGT
jgi:hypothetical protein